ncbi:unnamed protein product, partial [Ectocarpus sp. 12 AP-2014]
LSKSTENDIATYIIEDMENTKVMYKEILKTAATHGAATIIYMWSYGRDELNGLSGGEPLRESTLEEKLRVQREPGSCAVRGLMLRKARKKKEMRTTTATPASTAREELRHSMVGTRMTSRID